MKTNILLSVALFCIATTFSCAGDSDVEPVADESGEDVAITETDETSEEAAVGSEETVIVDTETTDIGEDVEISSTENVGEVCPECGSGNVIPIIYGKPAQELIDRSERGEVKLGGCVLSRESPYTYCKDCEAEW